MRLARYLVVGVIAFAIDLGCLLLLVEHLPLLAANTLAFLVANAANFTLGHVWVFGQSLGSAAAPQYAKVLAVSAVGLVINDAVVWTGVVLLSLPLVASKVVATLVALAWNFAARVRWIYPAERGA